VVCLVPGEVVGILPSFLVPLVAPLQLQIDHWVLLVLIGNYSLVELEMGLFVVQRALMVEQV